eukprot:9140099-Pyramimonas_sp.AAC.1
MSETTQFERALFSSVGLDGLGGPGGPFPCSSTCMKAAGGPAPLGAGAPVAALLSHMRMKGEAMAFA